jgi:serine/threonine protein kinase
MGTIYRARDKRLGRDVAVKVVAAHLADDELSVRRFRNEGQLCARLAHPNIVATLDVGPQYIVMELVDGLDAGKLLRKRGQLSEAETVRVIADVCDALTYAHGLGVVHHDVSLPNILVRDFDGMAKLADFGLAVGVWHDPPRGSPIGTPGYVAPELLHGAAATASSDLYSLGVVAYRLLTGCRSFRSGDPQATAPMPYATGPLPPLTYVRPDLSGRLIAAIRRAMADEPRLRQASVAEFRAEIRDDRPRAVALARSA